MQSGWSVKRLRQGRRGRGSEYVLQTATGEPASAAPGRMTAPKTDPQPNRANAKVNAPENMELPFFIIVVPSLDQVNLPEILEVSNADPTMVGRRNSFAKTKEKEKRGE